MQKQSIYAGLLGAALILLGSCANPVSLIRGQLPTLNEQDELVIVMYGDEISGGDTTFDRTNSWGGMLKPRLEKLFRKRISFINTSREYESFQEAHRRLEEDILSYRPDIVLLMLGRVDAYTTRLPQRTHKKNVEEFLGLLKKDDVFVVVLTPPGLRYFPEAADEEVQIFNSYIQTVRNGAQLYRYPVIDVTRGMARLMGEDPGEYVSLFADRSMLNRKGKEFVADYVYQYFEQAVNEQ